MSISPTFPNNHQDIGQQLTISFTAALSGKATPGCSNKQQMGSTN